MHPGFLKQAVAVTRRFGHWLAKENYLFGKLLGSSAAGILAIGLFPSTLWEVARHAAATLPFAGP